MDSTIWIMRIQHSLFMMAMHEFKTGKTSPAIIKAIYDSKNDLIEILIKNKNHGTNI